MLQPAQTASMWAGTALQPIHQKCAQENKQRQLRPYWQKEIVCLCHLKSITPSFSYKVKVSCLKEEKIKLKLRHIGGEYGQADKSLG